MTVSELIEKLKEVEDKSLHVYVYDVETGNRVVINMIDEIDDFCLDFNINS